MRKPEYIKEGFTEEEIGLIVKAIDSCDLYLDNMAGTFLRERDRAIFLFACFTGLRPLELLSLRWDQVDIMEKKIWVCPHTNKNREALPAILPDKAEQIIVQYKKVFDEFLKSKYIFPSLITLEPMQSDSWEKRLIQLQRKAGIYRVRYITKNGQPISLKTMYSTRKYYGTKIYTNTKCLETVKRALRHKNISSSEPYVLISTDIVRNNINQAI